MKSLFTLILVLLLFAAATARAEPPVRSPMFQQWVGRAMHLSVVGGRIATEPNGMQFGSGQSVLNDGKVHEQVSYTGNGATVSIKYQRTAPEGEFSIEIAVDGRFHLHNSVKAKPEENVDFRQDPGQPVVLTTGVESKPVVLQSPSLWHLLILHPDECKGQLLPLMDAVRPELHIARTATGIEAELVRLAAAGRQSDRKQWATWIDQLADPMFTHREAADRKLRAVGPAVVGFLGGLDLKKYDAEQQFRIRRMLKSLSLPAGEDTPEYAASTLIEDASIWLALLGRPDVAVRKAAAQQLAMILDGPLTVDPAADPASQQSARDELRARIEKLTTSLPIANSPGGKAAGKDLRRQKISEERWHW